MQEVDTTKPMVTLGCNALEDCGVRFHYQPKPGVAAPYSDISGDKMWCSGCGYLKKYPNDGLQLELT